MCSRVQGNDGRMELPTLTISASNGWMKQEDRFSGNIAGKEQKNYTLLHKGELSYNHGNSKLAKYGTVFSLQSYEEALVPRVYHSFKVEEGNTDFIEYYFATKLPDRELGKLISSGARMDGLLNIGYKEFMGIQLLFPKTKEQECIANYFRNLDNLITLHQRKFEKLTNVKKSMLEKMFPQNGSSYPEIRFKGFTDPWEQRKLSELTSMHARIGWQNLRTSEFLDSGNYMLITGTDFNDGAINFSTCHYVERERYEQDRNIQIHNGSILITKDGTLGKVAYVQGLSMPATLNAGVFNVQIKDANNVDEKYLFQYLKAPFLMDYVDKKATGGTIKHLNQSILVDFPVILPQRSEQTLIGAFFQQLDNLITLHQRKGKAAVTGCSNDANNSKGVYCKARDFGYKCCKKVESP